MDIPVGSSIPLVPSAGHDPGPAPTTEAGRLLAEGLRSARGVGHPVARARHVAAWAHRISAQEPERAAALLPECGEDAIERAQLLISVMRDRLRRGDSELEPQLGDLLALAREMELDDRLRVHNLLSEAAIEAADEHSEPARQVLHRLLPELETLTVPGDLQQPRALAAALLGEALLMLEDEAGLALLDESERLTRELPHADPVLLFLAGAYADRDPARAADLVSGLQDPSQRLEARLQLAEKAGEGELREQLFQAAEEDAAWVEHYRGPEALVRVGQALTELSPERSREFFRRAVESAERNGPQLRSLQLTGIAGAVAGLDREWSREIFAQSEAAAGEEPELVRRLTALAVCADAMADPFPREASELFDRVLAQAEELDALWEHAHFLDVVLRDDRSPYLDVSGVKALLERVIARLTDEDPRIPGVFGLPDAARLMLQVDPEGSGPVLRRWLEAAEAADDPDGMTGASLTLRRIDEAAGDAALERTLRKVEERVDCLSMGQFAGAIAGTAPRLALQLSPRIQDRRTRAEATALAATHLYPADPDAALEAIRALERPVDRSLALLRVVDTLLGTSDRPTPEPLLQELP
ncbi:MAG: hypothetical protein ACK47B_18420 [Armatimonadota bacterium]